MTTPHRCPCCDGWGKRQPTPPPTFSAHPDPVPCHACEGTGVLWEPRSGGLVPKGTIALMGEPVTIRAVREEDLRRVCDTCGTHYATSHVCLVRRESTTGDDQ